MRWTRREILGSGLAAATACTLGASARAAETPPPPQHGPRIGLSIAAYSFREYLPQGGKPGKISLHDLCDMAAGWNLDAIEPTSYYFSSEDTAYIHSLKAKAFRLGLDISGMPIRNNFCLPPGEELDAEIKHVHTWIDHALELGAPCIRIFAGQQKDPQKDFAWMVEGMKACCDYAGSRGVFLAIENHGYLTDSAEALVRIIENVNHEWLGINLDTGNFREHPYEDMAAVAHLALTVQVKIQVRTSDGTDVEDADFERIAGILRNANYRGYAALEYEGKEDPMSAVPVCLDRLRQVLKT
ncbi:MAG TPA: sugar phosphate isomerase/epimerase family protein [Candidatus Hydrogenedentes bacterium]|nr:sugar phosphate isomerase/epimerase family protein [Candidatus Hydrogenedentota bacterium]HQH54196.1 sugar phosphate isomerase/epimerase family protein [Candidatus Hydrogenedentota bacterium]HQM51186.1 sugar phosphate isomerase/epimerase family protein [Candidatus Hydrogenedentota bacterium]